MLEVGGFCLFEAIQHIYKRNKVRLRGKVHASAKNSGSTGPGIFLYVYIIQKGVGMLSHNVICTMCC